VAAAYTLFDELARRLRATPAERIAVQRVRVPGPTKARLLSRVLIRGIA
jgi:hypothetical protein